MRIFCVHKLNNYMNLIDLKLAEIIKRKRVGLMTHVVVGYPDLNTTIALVKAMVRAGADFVELQIPFSDPLADGPTIMLACERALRQGTKVREAFIVARKLSNKVSVPLLFMAYFNTIFVYGVEKFCRDARLAGISGLIVPDFPIEEEGCEHLAKRAKINGLHLIRVIAPASTEVRLRKNSAVAGGFVYCSSRQGITGAEKELSSGLAKYLRKVKEIFNIPVAVGFGISTRSHIRQISLYANIAVVGSAIINVINKSKPNLAIENVEKFVRSLRGQ